MVLTETASDRYRLRIAYFAGDDEFAERCREALVSVPAGAELTLDLRGNVGGSSSGALGLAEMLLPAGTPLARRRMRRTGGTFTPWAVKVSESDPLYLGPLAVLMDSMSASATEGLIGALKAAGRARLLGCRSAGASGNPRVFCSPGGIRFSCSSWEETTPEGEPVERCGITTRPWAHRL